MYLITHFQYSFHHCSTSLQPTLSNPPPFLHSGKSKTHLNFREQKRLTPADILPSRDLSNVSIILPDSVDMNTKAPRCGGPCDRKRRDRQVYGSRDAGDIVSLSSSPSSSPSSPSSRPARQGRGGCHGNYRAWTQSNQRRHCY